jgi:hypothetical protein
MTGMCPGCKAPVSLGLITPPDAAIVCPKCGQTWQAQSVKTAASYADQTVLYGEREPTETARGVVTFWSRPIRRRLEESTLSPGLAAKRDLERYHALIDSHRIIVPIHFARLICSTLPNDPETWAIGSDNFRIFWRDGTNLLDQLAVLDASDRCIAAHRREGGNLFDLLPRFFTLSPEPGEEE